MDPNIDRLLSNNLPSQSDTDDFLERVNKICGQVNNIFNGKDEEKQIETNENIDSNRDESS